MTLTSVDGFHFYLDSPEEGEILSRILLAGGIVTDSLREAAKDRLFWLTGGDPRRYEWRWYNKADQWVELWTIWPDRREERAGVIGSIKALTMAFGPKEAADVAKEAEMNTRWAR